MTFSVGIAALGSYLPGPALGVDRFRDGKGSANAVGGGGRRHAPAFRHHVAPGERAAEMIERAVRPMLAEGGIEPAGNIDVLMTNVLLPDLPITGSGAEAAARLECVPGTILDLHNAGCASFVYMLWLAEQLMASGDARTALLCTVQNSAGPGCEQPGLRGKPQTTLLGDGCGAAYLVARGGARVLAVATRNEPHAASAMEIAVHGGTRRYWEPGDGEFELRFDKRRLAEIVARGNRLVPQAVTDVCGRIGADPGEIDVLITNQPNRTFLRNWRKALGIPEDRHVDTFDRCGNLLGASVPVTLHHAVREGRVRSGDLVVLAGFAHAGDFAAAAALRWSEPAAQTS
jgi:3-oxoacyl-[acyl-carrier-protein] synthase-3